MFHLDDFSYYSQGKELADLTKADAPLLQAVEQRGEKKERALLLLHGFTSSPAVYRYLIPAIHSYDALVCPVLPGHAESIAAFSKTTAEQWRVTAMQHYIELIKKYEQVDVLGLSMGGLLALSLSQERPPNRLFLLAPACYIVFPASLLLLPAYLLKIVGIQSIRNSAGNLVNTDHAEIAYKKIPMSVLIEILRYIQHQQWTVPSCPIELFLGRHDRVVSSKRVAQLFSGCSRVKTHWLEHSAHVLPLDNDLQQIISVLNRE